MMLTATLYQWLLLVHIVAAMTWVGGAILLAALVTAVLRTGEPGAVERYVGALRVIGPRVLAPATIAVAGLGVWLVLNNSAWGFDQAWVQLALALFAAAFSHRRGAPEPGGPQRGPGGRRRGPRRGAPQLARWSWGYRLIIVLLVVAEPSLLENPTTIVRGDRVTHLVYDVSRSG